MKKQTKFIMVNHIPKSVVLKTENCGLHPYIKNLNLKDFSSQETFMFFTFRNLLFFSLDYQPSEIKSYADLKTFFDCVLKEFYSFQSDGFVNQRNLKINKIFNIFRSLYPCYNEIFDIGNPPFISWRYELEHFHNLIILVLIFELELYISNHSVEENDNTIEELVLMKQVRSELNSLLSGGIRLSLSKNRLLVVDRIYVGFDTEYKSLDSRTNKILCYTTSTLTESFIKIRNGNVDYSLKEGLSYIPQTSMLISIGIKLIRFLRNKKDFELENLKRSLKKDRNLKCLVLDNHDFIFKADSISINSINSSFFDLRNNPSSYSFKNMLDVILKDHKQPMIIKSLKLTGFNPTLKQECFLTAHFTAADVSLFNDFEEIKDKFTVLNKSFLTLDKLISYKKWKVYLRDSALLSPSGMSLKSIGDLYSDLPLSKINLSKKDIENMDVFFDRDKESFKTYAMQDSRIVLWHVLQVQNSLYQLTGRYTIPVTLSSLASSFLTKRLVKETSHHYHPKTKNGLISVRNLARLNTPMGIELSGDLHEYIDYFLGSYHGGRNESFVYGIVRGEFHDYDLPGAYPTAMAMLDYPDWGKKQMIGEYTGEEFLLKFKLDIINSYSAFKIKFEFPETVKYPNLPVRLDFSSVVFPLTGESFCTGHEFLLAMNLGCKIRILSGVYIPFHKSGLKEPTKMIDSERSYFIQDPSIKRLFNNFELPKLNFESTDIESENYNFLKRQLSIDGNEDDTDGNEELKSNQSNFFLVVQELIRERVKYPKGSYMNLLYKFLANAGIGQMARGLNQKVKFDVRSNSTKPLPSGELVSPLYAGWITSFIRTTLSEIMNKNNNKMIISCTTDGFISDEPKLDTVPIDSKNVFSFLYYTTRLKLTGAGALLEKKYTENKGVISWRTRGQLGLSGGIKALTGYQRHESIEETIDKVNKSFNDSKQIAFIQTSLRSAKEIYQNGGHSTLKLEERLFNLKYDNRREITDCKGTFHITKPFVHCLNSSQNRLIASLGAGRYRKYSPISKTHCKGDAYLSLTRRMITRLLRDQDLIQIKLTRLDILRVLKEIGLKSSLNFISKQKGKLLIYNSIPSTEKTLVCLRKLNVLFPNLNPELLLRR